MSWTADLWQMPLLCAGLFFLAAVVMYVFPPKKRNAFYGYRTSSSMKSDAHWQFAQRFSVVKMFQGSLFLALSSGLGLLIHTEQQTEQILGIALPLVTVLGVLLVTESALKTKFPNT